MFQLALEKRIMVFKSKTYEDSLIIYGFWKSGLHHSFDSMLKISFRMVATISIAGYVTKKVKWYVVMYAPESITKVACRASDHFLITRNSFVQNVQKFRTPRILTHVSKVWKMCRYQETFIKIAIEAVTWPPYNTAPLVHNNFLVTSCRQKFGAWKS